MFYFQLPNLGPILWKMIDIRGEATCTVHVARVQHGRPFHGAYNNRCSWITTVVWTSIINSHVIIVTSYCIQTMHKGKNCKRDFQLMTLQQSVPSLTPPTLPVVRLFYDLLFPLPNLA